jgi:hypothetical protein
VNATVLSVIPLKSQWCKLHDFFRLFITSQVLIVHYDIKMYARTSMAIMCF